VIPLKEFAGLDRSFWAHVKLVSERLGYSERGARGTPKRLRRYSLAEIVRRFGQEALRSDHLYAGGAPTKLGRQLEGYLNVRAELLEKRIEPVLMSRAEAAKAWKRLRARQNYKCALPMNKQKGDKAHPAYMVGIINMLTERSLRGRGFADDPRGLAVVTKDGRPLRTFSRWMDGAYPSIVDPYALWEIKEYYGTTTFGSRVADGVYETMLDGHEFDELRLLEKRKVYHYLIVDDRFTWWDCGRSYLCRIVDMLHQGLVDEALFGREVFTRWPAIVREWP